MHKLATAIHKVLGWKQVASNINTFSGHLLFKSRWGDLLFVEPSKKRLTLLGSTGQGKFSPLLKEVPLRRPFDLITAARRSLQFQTQLKGEIELYLPYSMKATFTASDLTRILSEVERAGEVDVGVDRITYRISTRPFRTILDDPALFHRDLFYWVGLVKR